MDPPAFTQHILGAGAMIIGTAAILSPFTMARFLGIVPTDSTAVMTRAFGSRDLVLGLGIEYYQRGTLQNRIAMAANGLVHAIDVVNAVVSYVQGYLPFEALVAVGGMDTVLTALCVWELSRFDSV